MRLARESTLRVHVSEERWADVRADLTDKQMVELALTIAWYNSGVRIMALLDIELEEAYRKDSRPVRGGWRADRAGTIGAIS